MPNNIARAAFVITFLQSVELGDASRVPFPAAWAGEPTTAEEAAAPLPVVVGALVDVTWGSPVTAAIISQGGNTWTLQVKVPSRKHPGQVLKVRLPNGDIRPFEIPPGASAGNFFQISYDAFNAAQKKLDAEGPVEARLYQTDKRPVVKGHVIMPNPPIYTGNILNLQIEIPNSCGPACIDLTMQIPVNSYDYWLTTPSGITVVPGNILRVHVPIPEPPPVIPTRWWKNGGTIHMVVVVPPPRMPGQMVAVATPHDGTRLVSIPPGVYAGQNLEFSYNPVAELIAKIMTTNRCCCHDTKDLCFWVSHAITKKKGGHCPRFQEKARNSFCALKKCKAFDSKCKKSHYTPDEQGIKCRATTDSHAYIREC